jgi:superoxide dismutase, Fe-Mn family
MFFIKMLKTSFIRSFVRSKHTLPKLPFAYNALEPYITGNLKVYAADVMEVHHGKHHQAYVNNLNATEEKLQTAVQNNDITTQFSLQSALKFNMGGHINHSFFWENLAPISMGGGKLEDGLFLLTRSFVGYDQEGFWFLAAVY